MRATRSLAAAVVMAVVPAASLQAQELDSRSPVLAGAIELFVPTAGFAYAGDWKRGLPSNAVRVAVVVAAIVGEPCDSGDDWRCAAMGAALVASHAWVTVGAVNTARDHNRRVAGTQVGLMVGAGANGSIGVGLALRH